MEKSTVITIAKTVEVKADEMTPSTLYHPVNPDTSRIDENVIYIRPHHDERTVVILTPLDDFKIFLIQDLDDNARFVRATTGTSLEITFFQS